MKLNAKKFGLAAGGAFAVLWGVCSLLVLIMPSSIDLSPKNRTMTSMRFPLKWVKWRSRYEKTLQRRTNYKGHQRA